eukprot:TRINITY_DN3693_c0_g1_i1.p2 TRINITY_DN3693_c0_g1~~TRINITY_DN3693_c0_g1_i1.p2  ORF type:complete len:179 (-),score=73.92 TRINITY_DN3693_c0_g1_i1:282-818(-)
MKVIAVFTILIALSAAEFQDKNIQEFFDGIFLSMNVNVNPTVLQVIGRANFNSQQFEQAYTALKTQTHFAKENAISGLRDCFFSFQRNAAALLVADPNMRTATDNIVQTLWDFKGFEVRANAYKKKTRRDVFAELNQMFNQVVSRDYKGAGWTFGNIITNLRKFPLQIQLPKFSYVVD